MKTSSFSWGGIAALSLLLAAGLARAQDSAPPDADPPDRAGRLSYLQGEVSLQPAGEEEWADAILNRPLTTDDKLWTDRNARAEIQVGPAAVRLDGETGFSFLNVDDDTIQMRVTAGVINVSVRTVDADDHIEIDTPNLALSLLRPGTYRVEVNDSNDTTVVRVREGEAEASVGSRTAIVHAQQSATFTGWENLAPQFGSLGRTDEFDEWSLERERRDLRASQSQSQYVAPDVTGYEDLDDHGTWSSDVEYGYVWTPRSVAVDWSPYRYGRWVWVRPWGWTWIDDAPWGYAPFHYGRWAHVRDRWCWVPGPRHVRAVYAPALVGWVEPGIGLTISTGRPVGWFPLGPREIYVPARRYSPRYWERVNTTNTLVDRVLIRDAYENRARNVHYRNRSAVTVVTRTTFTSAARVGGNRVRFDDRELTRTGVVARTPDIAPVRESRLGEVAARARVRPPPQTVASRQVVVRRSPPPSAAHFARNVGQIEPRVERRPDRPQERGDRRDTPNRTVPDNRPDNRADARAQLDENRNAAPVEGNVRDTRDRRDTPSIRQRTDRPPRAYQPRVDDDTRDRQVREQQVHQLQERQADQQQREQQQREQQQRQQQQEHQRQEREQQGRQMQVRQAEQQQREQHAQRQQEERAVRQQREVEQRPAPQQAPKPERAEPRQPDKQPQRDNDNNHQRRQENDRR